MPDPESKETPPSSDLDDTFDADLMAKAPSAPDSSEAPSQSQPSPPTDSKSPPPPSHKSPPSGTPPPPLDETGDEEIAGDEIPGLSDPEPPTPSGRLFGLKPIELAGLGGVALIILALFLTFRSTLVSQIPIAQENEIARTPQTPVKGTLVGIAHIDSLWRAPAQGERVKSNQALIPAIHIRLLENSQISSNGYIRVIIRDSDGKIRGDVSTRQVINGTFGDSGANEISVIGTEGFERSIDFGGYGMNGENTWSAEILEGPSYDGDSWERLDYFTISHHREKSANP